MSHFRRFHEISYCRAVAFLNSLPHYGSIEELQVNQTTFRKKLPHCSLYVLSFPVWNVPKVKGCDLWGLQSSWNQAPIFREKDFSFSTYFELSLGRMVWGRRQPISRRYYFRLYP